MINWPRLQFTAKSRHCAAAFNIINDLLLYRDPEQRRRNFQVQEFQYKYSENLVEAAQIALHVQELVRRIQATYLKQIHEVSNTPHSNIQSIIAHGKSRIEQLRKDLSMIFEAISKSVNQHPGQSKKNFRALRAGANIGQVSWHLMEDTDTMFAKLTIKQLHFRWLKRIDNSTLNVLLLGDVEALNSSPDALFSEILTKSVGGTGASAILSRGNKVSDLKRLKSLV